jgi:hypothetical protein
MSQEAAARPFVKSTHSLLSEVLSAYWSGDRLGGTTRFNGGNGLIDLLHVSPRLTQWAKIAEGYRIWSADEALSVTVTQDKIYTTKGSRVDDLQTGLPAQALYSAIQTAQQIVQSNGSTESDEEYFKEGEEGYSDGAGLDAALEETHAAPLAEDDAELIEDVTAEDALNEDQRTEDGPVPVVTVSKKFIEDIQAPAKELNLKPEAESYLQKTNRKNAATDGVICPYCGNLNKDAYRGGCPQCPKQQQQAIDKVVGSTSKEMSKGAVARLKSLQGRILTIIDGTFSDKTQREAVKTLINKEFRRDISNAGSGGVYGGGVE